MKTILDIAYTNQGHPEQKLDIYLPDTDKFPVFVYFHGGGIEAGDKKFWKDENESASIPLIVERGIAVISANYRMYPEAHYPEFICDCAAAVAWAKKHMGEYGEVTGLFVGGSSAGGYISQMLCFDKKYLAPYRIDADTITGYIHDAGQPTAHFNVLRERGIDSHRVIIDETAPIYHVEAGRDYAPMCVIVAENDMQNRFEQTQLLLGTMKHLDADMSKVDYRYMQGYKHCQYVDSKGKTCLNDFAEVVCDFIEKTME